MRMDSQIPRNLKRYEKPAASQLTREQAILKLRAYADQGDPGAKELLDKILAQVAAKDVEVEETLA